jgi:hypothetical protein
MNCPDKLSANSLNEKVYKLIHEILMFDDVENTKNEISAEKQN